MNTYKKLFIIFAFIFGLSFAQSTLAITFSEYAEILARSNITLTAEQETMFRAFFDKEPTQIKNTSTSSDKTDFSDFTYSLKKNTKDSETNGQVSKLQRILNQTGISVGAVDGYFGPQTARGVEELKSQHNITNTPHGVFDPRDFSASTNIQNMNMFLASDEVYFYTLPFAGTTSDIEKLTCNNRDVSYFLKDREIIFPLTFPYGEQTSFSCYLDSNEFNGKFLHIIKKETPKETSYATITVSKTFTSISTENNKRIADEKEMLAKLYSKGSTLDMQFNSPFTLPIESKLLSPFGKTRIINGKVSSYHSGTDFKAQTPQPIHASNDGVVMFAGNLFYCGNTVIINHGMDIFTTYCHLSDIKTKTGDTVSQGDIIGLSGDTGRVSGPHIHLLSKFQGNYMDFMSIYENSKNLN